MTFHRRLDLDGTRRLHTVCHLCARSVDQLGYPELLSTQINCEGRLICTSGSLVGESRTGVAAEA